MTYTVTCPDPECATTFEVDEPTFDAAYEDDDSLACPGCEREFEWDYDPEKADGEEITLTRAVEYEGPVPESDADDETCELCGELVDEYECDEED